jgi:FtsZ-binding cell division protein ZapB
MLKLKETREKLEQFQDEAGMWLRTLDFIKQENNFLKNRLSAVVDNQSDKSFLAQAEHFQNQFIIKDEFMDELKHDVNEQVRDVKIYGMKNAELNGHAKYFSNMQDNLRDQMTYLEKEFTSLRNEFYAFLTKQIWS